MRIDSRLFVSREMVSYSHIKSRASLASTVALKQFAKVSLARVYRIIERGFAKVSNSLPSDLIGQLYRPLSHVHSLSCVF